MDFKGKDFLKLLDFTPDEITALLDLAAELKAKKKAGIPHKLCDGKSVALIFEKTSTRTRCAFEVAAHDLGMGTTYLDPSGSQIGKKESIADTARVLGRMYEGIEYRGFGQEIVEELAKYSKVPVWNGLTNEYHPTQMLADILQTEADAGNYVIAGGDFNQTFSNVDLSAYPQQSNDLWAPGLIDTDEFGQDFTCLTDSSAPTCRSLDKPYVHAAKDNFQYYVIDGFIVSSNVKVKDVQTIDLGFENSDHNPLKLEVELTR